MIRMVAYRFCDICKMADGNAEVLADESIRWDVGGKPLRVDVCPDHKDPTWQTMTAAAIPDMERSKNVAHRAANAPAKIAAAAQADGGSSRQDNDPGTCPVCGNHYEWLSTHISNSHGLKPAKARNGEFRCPLCDETTGTPTRLGNHVKVEHGRRLMHVLAEQAS